MVRFLGRLQIALGSKVASTPVSGEWLHSIVAGLRDKSVACFGLRCNGAVSLGFHEKATLLGLAT